VVGLSYTLSRLAPKKPVHADGSAKPYACGEDMPRGHMIQPNYAQFVPFAFFFTILHVIALMATTVPVETPEVFVIAVTYLLGAVVGLSILYRR
jgi:NADH-quinone oxidoreductase subunit A